MKLRTCVPLAKRICLLLLVTAAIKMQVSAQKTPVGNTTNDPIPANATLLNESKDARGNTVRTIQYLKHGIKVKETIVIPPKYVFVKIPVNPDTLNKDSLTLIIDKSDRALRVFYKRKMLRSYKAVFGPKPMQDKCKKGDRCTPEGWFTIIGKNPSVRYNKFMHISYPNDSAYVRFNMLKAKGLIPKNAEIGGDVGIHGIWKGGDDMIELNVGWTDGCIALKNKDVDELYTFVSVGTRVWIRK